MDRFVFWGVFVAFAVIVVAYSLWMVRTERRERQEHGADGDR